jgi:D-alanyl-D-alanine carboxypeptidase
VTGLSFRRRAPEKLLCRFIDSFYDKHMQRRNRFFDAFKVLLLLALVMLAGSAIYARWLVDQKAGFVVGNWQLRGDQPLATQIQSGLDAETKANPNILGQSLHVSAPRLGIDTTFVSGPELLPTDDVRVASNIKPFVAAAALKLVEQGKLSLSAPIGPYLSEPMRKILADRGDTLTNVTLRDLLNHSSGIPDFGNSQIFQAIAYIPTAFGFARHWTPQEEVWFGAKMLPNPGVGAGFDYSDTNYLLASDMIAKATGAPNAGIALSNLLNWKAIGADETFWEGYEPTPTGTRLARHFRGGIEDTKLDISFDQYGGGGLVMSLDDLAHAHRAIVQGKIFGDPKMITLMQTPGVAPGSEGYGLGVEKMVVEGVTCWGHGGRWGTVALSCPSIDLTLARSTGQANASPDSGDPLGVVAGLVRLLKEPTQTSAP